MHLISEVLFILRILEVAYLKVRHGLAVDEITLCFFFLKPLSKARLNERRAAIHPVWH